MGCKLKILIALIAFITAQLQINPLLAKTPKSKPTIYFLAGQGADHRLFQKLELAETYKIEHINYTVPEKGMTMTDYAEELATQIDTTKPFILIGTSLGGMLTTEMNEFLSPEKTIIIASAKSRDELPFRYRFQKKFPIYKLVTPKMAWLGAFVMQPLVEPDRNKEKDTFKQMLKDKDPLFLDRTIEMIINWNRTSYSEDIVHIHGNKDHTIPIRNIKYDFLVDKGSHMMTLTKALEISHIIVSILNKSEKNKI